RVALNLAWMPLTPEKLIGELLSKPAHLEAAAPDLIEAERNLILRAADAPWTEADVPLLDEAAELLGEMDASAGRDRAQQEADRARDIANAEQSLRNVDQSLRDIGINGLVSAEDLAGYNQTQQNRLTAAER